MRQQSGGWGGEKGGEMTVDLPGQHVLERTSVLLAGGGDLEARFTVALPARGRTVLGAWAAAILVTNLPRSGRSAPMPAAHVLAAVRPLPLATVGTGWCPMCQQVCQDVGAACCGHDLQL